MAGDTEQLPGYGSLEAVVTREADGKGMRLMEVVIRRLYAAPDSNMMATMLCPGPLSRAVTQSHPDAKEQLLASLRSHIAKCKYDLKEELLEEAATGTLVLTGVYMPLGTGEVVVDADTLERGQLDVLGETLTDYRTDHAHRYFSLRIVPRLDRIKLLKLELLQLLRQLNEPQPVSKRNRADMFIAAMDAGEIEWQPDPEDPTGRIITTTKAEAYRMLRQKHHAMFGTWKSFDNRYARSGEWTKALGFSSIRWASDHSDQ